MKCVSMDVIAFIKTIYEWFCSLDIVDKIVGAIVSFLTTGLIKRIWERLKPSPEEKAFMQAVKRWQSSSYVRALCFQEDCQAMIGR